MNLRLQARIAIGRHDSFGSRRAFTLIELLVVMGIIGLLLALTVPAVTGLIGSTSLSTATRQVSNLLTLARTEAIAQNTVTRFAVATNWPGESDASNRRFCIWAWNRALGDYEVINDWETLPTGVIFEPALPSYLSNAEYAAKDTGTVRCDYFLDDSNQEFIRDFRNQSVAMRFIEFGPSGSAQMKESNHRWAAIVLTEGFFDGGSGQSSNVTHTSMGDNGPKNWAQINVDNLTGRVRIFRP